jgi:hypothetical protein
MNRELKKYKGYKRFSYISKQTINFNLFNLHNS